MTLEAMSIRTNSIMRFRRALSRLRAKGGRGVQSAFRILVFGGTRNYSYRKSFKLPITANLETADADE